MKHFIKQKLFGKPSSAQASRGFPSHALSVAYLDEVSCFETLRAYRGKIFRLAEHLGRLSESCRGIGRSAPFTPQGSAKWLGRALKESGFKDALLRVSVHWEGEGGSLVAIIREFTGLPRELAERGVRLQTAVPKRSAPRAQDPQIKSSQFVSGVAAFLDDGNREPYEYVFLSQTGIVAEGTVSNIFLLKEKRLLTPHASSGILRGVTRSAVIELAEKMGLAAVETLLTRHELYNAEECFITNTSSEILPVVSIDGRRIGEGAPGPVTRKLAKDFQKLT
ncbi:MAG: aminotransferase class IV [Candidatus Omnitrophota bacterium]